MEETSIIKVIGSGSKGNSTFVRTCGLNLLIDAGLSLMQMDKALQGLNIRMESLDAVLVTHEHSDHVRSLKALLKRAPNAVVIATSGTHGAIGVERALTIERRGKQTLGDVEVTAVPIEHDAAEPCAFRIDSPTMSFGSITDLGVWSDEIVEEFAGVDAMVVEFNHDVDMLRRGPYPYFLKKRVGGSKGHLSNWQGARLLDKLVHENLHAVVLGHLSQKNNAEEHARRSAAEVLAAHDSKLMVAAQNTGADLITLAASSNRRLGGKQLSLL